MKMSFRGVSYFMTGAAFVTFAFLSPNCQPAAGTLGGESGNSGGDGGSGGSGGTSSSSGGSNSSSGGSNSSSGGSNSSSGGSNSSSGGSNTSSGGSNSSSGGSASKGGSNTSSGGSNTSSGGSNTSNGGTTPSSGGTVASNGGTTTAPTCTPQPTSKGGLACPGGKCTVGTFAGYDFKFADSDPPKTGKSTICMAADSLCATGTLAAQDPPTYANWGAGIGFNFADPSADIQLAGTGVSITLSSLPTGTGATARAQLTIAGTDYCAVFKAASTTFAWSDFNTTCWDMKGTSLTAAPKVAKIQVQAASGTAAGAFDFCVTAVTIQ
jgi:hypothetical protein